MDRFVSIDSCHIANAAHYPDENLNSFWYAIEFYMIIQSCLLVNSFETDIHIINTLTTEICFCAQR